MRLTEATGSAPAEVLVGVAPRLARRRGPGIAADRSRRRERDGQGRGKALGGCLDERRMLYNALGRYDAALAARNGHANTMTRASSAFSLVELVEAGVRSGAYEEAAAALRRLERTNRRCRHRVGARHPGLVTCAAQRRAGCRLPLPRGDRATRAQSYRRPSRPRAPGVRRMAASREPPRRRA